MTLFAKRGKLPSQPIEEAQQSQDDGNSSANTRDKGLFQSAKRSRYWASEYLFQQNLIEIMVKVTVVVTPLIGLGYLAAYFMVDKVWSTFVLALGLFGLSPVSLIALYLAKRGGIKIAAQIYMFYMWLLGGLLTLFLSDSLILIGILVLTLNSLLALFIEDLNVAVRWIGAMILMYLLMIVLRLTGDFPSVVLGFVEPVFLFVAPVAIFITIVLLGNATIYYLRSTLLRSEELRSELEESYAEARLATAVAQEANRLKSEFLSMMSHELRTPLNAIIGFSEILDSGMAGSVDGEGKKMIGRVIANARHLLALINDILDLSKIEARQHEVIVEELSPSDLLKSTYDQMISLTQSKGLEFKLDISATLPPLLYSDRSVIKQIVMNLLSNAIKFTEDGWVKLVSTSDHGTWTITVQDSGIGIPPHALEYIFDPFRQVDGTSSRKHGGTGLGLAIVKEYVNELGGVINVESKLGEGSTFTLSFPLITAKDQAKEIA
jgi:signal transduction histidine kinase